MTASTTTHAGEDVTKRTEQNPGQSKPEHIGYLAQVIFSTHLDFSGFSEVAEDERSSLPSALFVCFAGLAWGSVVLGQLGAAGPAVGIVAALAVWGALSSIVWMLSKSNAGASAALPALLRGQSMAVFPILVFPIVLWTGTSVPYLTESIQTLLYSAAVFWFVGGTREILGDSLPRAIVLCAPALAVAAVILSLVQHAVPS